MTIGGRPLWPGPINDESLVRRLTRQGRGPKREELYATHEMAGWRGAGRDADFWRVVGFRRHDRLLTGGRRGRLAPGLLEGHAGRGEEGRHRPQVRRRAGQGRRA